LGAKAIIMSGDSSDRYNCLLRIVNFVPPGVVVGIIAWPYYVYVFVNCEILMEDEVPGPMFGVICLVIHHILMFFLIWSFAMSIMVDPGRVPEWFALLEMERQGMHLPDKLLNLDKREYEQLAQESQGGSIEKKQDGSGRWCRKCVKVKPDRCHHCRVCQRCVLKMDHHCPWINNCVGYYNYKYFYLFILYALLILFWVSSTSFLNFLVSIASDDVLDVWSSSFMIVFCWLYCTLLGVALGGFVTFHTYLLVQNFTTIELVEKKGSPARGKTYLHPWDLKSIQNIKECLGPHVWLWMIPTRLHMRGNGVRFPPSQEYLNSQASANRT
jgi:palmitoyltransferase